jgi:hypothetical protein
LSEIKAGRVRGATLRHRLRGWRTFVTRRSPVLVTLLSAAVLSSGCAATRGTAPVGPAPAARPQGSSDAMVSGEGGLGISGQNTPAALQALVAAPYALPSTPDCAVMAREIADLDGILGPDVDAIAAARNNTGQAIGSAMRSVVPYRWVMRLMTQAGRRDRDLRLAVLAGTARRGYLKGLRRGLACQPPQAPAR